MNAMGGKKLAAISRADLLRFLLDTPGLNDDVAAVLGFERQPPHPDPGIGQKPPTTRVENGAAPGDPPPSPEPEIDIPAQRPRLKFLIPTRAETLQPEGPRTDPPDPPDPITDEELRVPWGRRGLPLRPLVRWPRLAPFLRNCLGTSISGRQLDVRKLMRLAGTGLPLVELPRRKRTTWAAQAVLLWDDTPEMYPFAQDISAICHRLRRERGTSGLTVIRLQNVPRIQQMFQVPGGTPVLAISAMGQFRQDPVIQQEWLTFGRRLECRSHNFFALSPCPRNRWTRGLAKRWPTAVWDRGHRFPRRVGMGAHPAGHGVAPDAVERLLNLLSPASLIEPPLLRETRLRLGRSADTGTEWDAWHHADCWHTMDCFGLREGDTLSDRLRQRAEMAAALPELTAASTRAINDQHQTCSVVIAAEAELRACLSGTRNELSLERIQKLLHRVVDRLRKLAETPDSREGHRSGLPAWFADMVQRLSPEIRQDTSVQEEVARSLALVHTWQNAPSQELPRGVNPRDYQNETTAAGKRLREPKSPVDYVVGYDGASLAFFPEGETVGPCFSVASIRAGGTRRLQAEIQSESVTHHTLQLDSGSRADLTVSTTTTEVNLTSSHGRLSFDLIERPVWASRLWYDRFGIAAEFTVQNVPFVLRWIPPGRFLMGSPDNEAGRWTAEGPQHEVTISQGFWLGETPVTQAQWAAVVEAGLKQKSLWKRLFQKDAIKAKPSHFDGPGDLPVEQVSWHHSTAYCRLLDTLMNGGPGFSLPTEAQWEYACRAATAGAFHVDGSACTAPAGLDPALDGLGWFDKNSRAKTHPVKGKLPNHWGLYDMHGNVWEWCLDAWNQDEYQTRSNGVVDPVHIDEEAGAHRVLRGGSWRYQARFCRAACRVGDVPGDGWGVTGLRLSAGQGEFRDPAELRGAERPELPPRRSRG